MEIKKEIEKHFFQQPARKELVCILLVISLLHSSQNTPFAIIETAYAILKNQPNE